ncbi:hypothetical protein TPHA_0H02020 [Tetrapisispora phaffii CBS 4417]|uniref:Uncharacterized protein n=1 Tax=Tetrapisispora phaffii (strain ATCC 24235 / CBS 4417 / NBRC 1672 / NRRL Y-8282 / UCD 70-5) TaxID=1071381 RepID=G8BWF5_TETPH|nr:hypothetical protein TPHA_0H02020 [Tetrapisispora phaffii CBS 4417]CCE64406.1 hypothetical protein TPHA_0H02020 [Tetrapisispora phaffii CBS 4417]
MSNYYTINNSQNISGLNLDHNNNNLNRANGDENGNNLSLSPSDTYIPISNSQFQQEQFTSINNMEQQEQSEIDDDDLLFSMEIQQPYELNDINKINNSFTSAITNMSISNYGFDYENSFVDPAQQNYKLWLSSF